MAAGTPAGTPDVDVRSGAAPEKARSHSEDIVIAALQEVARSIAQMFGSTCEVVVHDLRSLERSIVHISNGHVSGRKLGGPIVGGPLNDPSLKWLDQPGESHRRDTYEMRTRDGKRLKSSSTVFRTGNSKPFAALCINLDVSHLDRHAAWLKEITSVMSGSATAESASADSSDVDAILELLLAETIGTAGEEISRQRRRQIVEALDAKGTFLIRGAVKKVATALGVSKYTIYSDLESARPT